MLLTYAYLCTDCTEINDRAPQGVCKRCGSESIISLSRALSDNPAGLPGKRLETAAPVHCGRLPLAERL